MLTSAPLAAASRVVRVLVVERTPRASRMIRDQLAGGPALHVQLARTVESACRLLRETPFTALLIDEGLWDEDAGAIASVTRAERPDLAVVLLVDGLAAAVARRPHGDASPHRIRRHELTETMLNAVIERAVGGGGMLRRRETLARWLELEARTDHLSGLFSRRTFEERLHDACNAARRRGEPVSVLTVNIAGMAAINEARGEKAGDTIIREVAGRVARATRACDLTARIGGDDFAVLLPGADLDLAKRIARRITQEIARLNEERRTGDVVVAVTFGVATGTRCDPVELLSAAESQLSMGARRAHLATILPTQYEDVDGPSVA